MPTTTTTTTRTNIHLKILRKDPCVYTYHIINIILGPNIISVSLVSSSTEAAWPTILVLGPRTSQIFMLIYFFSAVSFSFATC